VKMTIGNFLETTYKHDELIQYLFL
jgi:hypothetical protein